MRVCVRGRGRDRVCVLRYTDVRRVMLQFNVSEVRGQEVYTRGLYWYHVFYVKS